MSLRKPVNNKALLDCLEAVKPDDLSINAWLKQAGVGSSFFTNLRKGSEPGIYKIERLIEITGVKLSTFWKRVEARRKI